MTGPFEVPEGVEYAEISIDLDGVTFSAHCYTEGDWRYIIPIALEHQGRIVVRLPIWQRCIRGIWRTCPEPNGDDDAQS